MNTKEKLAYALAEHVHASIKRIWSHWVVAASNTKRAEKTKTRHQMNSPKSWGDSIFWFNFEKRRIAGYLTPMIQVGDELVCQMQSGKHMLFNVIDVEQQLDPPDQFFATVEDVGYLQ